MCQITARKTLFGGLGCHYHNRYREYYDEVLQCGRQIGFNSKYSTCKWDFTAKEQGCSP